MGFSITLVPLQLEMGLLNGSIGKDLASNGSGKSKTHP
jgi:hypothetical protein